MSGLSLRQLVAFGLVCILVNIMMTHLPIYLPTDLPAASRYMALFRGVSSGAED